MVRPPRLHDPLNTKTTVARGADVEIHIDHARLTFWNDVGDGSRYVVCRLVMALADYREFVAQLGPPSFMVSELVNVIPAGADAVVASWAIAPEPHHPETVPTLNLMVPKDAVRRAGEKLIAAALLMPDGMDDPKGHG